jgi:ribosomal protein L44E
VCRRRITVYRYHPPSCGELVESSHLLTSHNKSYFVNNSVALILRRFSEVGYGENPVFAAEKANNTEKPKIYLCVLCGLCGKTNTYTTLELSNQPNFSDADCADYAVLIEPQIDTD